MFQPRKKSEDHRDLTTTAIRTLETTESLTRARITLRLRIPDEADWAAEVIASAVLIMVTGAGTRDATSLASITVTWY